jgi:hypothetical protein
MQKKWRSLLQIVLFGIKIQEEIFMDKKLFCFLCMSLVVMISAENLFSQDTVSLTGTEWIFIDDDEDYGTREYPYIIRFSNYGVLNVFLEGDTTPDDDSWIQNGNAVIFYYNDEYVKHTGKIINNNFIEGIAINVGGLSWKFRLIRKGDW